MATVKAAGRAALAAAMAWVRRRASTVILVAIVIGLSGSELLWNVHQQRAFEQAQLAAQAAARRAEQLAEHKLCLTLDGLAALTPPPGNPAANPARAYDQQLHATLAQLAPDIGCGPDRRPR